MLKGLRPRLAHRCRACQMCQKFLRHICKTPSTGKADLQETDKDADRQAPPSPTRRSSDEIGVRTVQRYVQQLLIPETCRPRSEFGSHHQTRTRSCPALCSFQTFPLLLPHICGQSSHSTSRTHLSEQHFTRPRHESKHSPPYGAVSTRARQPPQVTPLSTSGQSWRRTWKDCSTQNNCHLNVLRCC